MANIIDQEGEENNAEIIEQEGKGNYVFNRLEKSTIIITTNSSPDNPNSSNAHTSILASPPDKNPFLPNLVFFGIVLLLTALVFLIPSLILLKRCPPEFAETVCQKADSEPIVFIFQFVLILFLMVTVGITCIKKALNRFSRLNYLVKESFHQFIQGWVALWSTWMLMYFIISLVLWLKADFPAFNFALQITVDFLNITNSLTFFYLFLVLDIESVPNKRKEEKGEENKERNEVGRNAKFKQHLKWLLVICVSVFIITATSRLLEPTLPKIGFLIYASGLLVGLSMAYVFGRLDSHYMRVKRWQLAPLYIYAVIQPLGIPLINFNSVALSSEVLYQDHFFVAVTLLKLLFFIFVNIWLYHDGYFEVYFDRGVKEIEDIRSKNFD
jgi:hypothetical protein